MNNPNNQDTPKARANKSDRCGCVCHDHKAKWESCDDCLLFHDAPNSQETLKQLVGQTIVSAKVDTNVYGEPQAHTIQVIQDKFAKFFESQLALVQQEARKEGFKRGQRVGQYQAADRLYSHVTTMWLFKDNADPKLQMPERANDLLKDCEKYMNHNAKVYREYVSELNTKADKEKTS